MEIARIPFAKGCANTLCIRVRTLHTHDYAIVDKVYPGITFDRRDCLSALDPDTPCAFDGKVWRGGIMRPIHQTRPCTTIGDVIVAIANIGLRRFISLDLSSDIRPLYGVLQWWHYSPYAMDEVVEMYAHVQWMKYPIGQYRLFEERYLEPLTLCAALDDTRCNEDDEESVELYVPVDHRRPRAIASFDSALEVRDEMRAEARERTVADVFALIVFHCDDYVAIHDGLLAAPNSEQ